MENAPWIALWQDRADGVDDAVGEPLRGDDDLRGFGNRGDGEEDVCRRDDDLGTVRLETEELHTQLGGVLPELVGDTLEALDREAVYVGALRRGAEAKELIDIPPCTDKA